MNTSKIDYLVIQLDDEKEHILDSCKTITNYFSQYGFKSLIRTEEVVSLVKRSALDDGYKCVVLETKTKAILFEYPYLENPGDYCVNYTDIKCDLQ